jgi:phosphatidylserine/phosphatidylglycerophosphate/cardiolipin synthase-like enzyme
VNTVLPKIGIVQTDGPATYLLTPFQDGEQAYLAFLSTASNKIRMMIYGFTLDSVVDALIAAKAKGLDIKIIFDHSQSAGCAEHAAIEKLCQGGFKDGVDFLIGTSPEDHAINHLKSTWIDDTSVLSGSWNYSTKASQEFNDITVVTAPAVAALYDQMFTFAWGWIQSNESSYNNISMEV